jgi:CRISPR-associated protein Cst2
MGHDEDKQVSNSSDRKANVGQMIFSRQSSSGVYAFVAHLDVAAIGFNTYTQEYPDKPDGIYVDRNKRMRSAVMALAQTILHPKGALTSNQLPHVVDVEGFVSTSLSAAAAPLISPLNDDYINRAEKAAGLLNELYGDDTVHIHSFTGPEGLLERIVNILDNSTPGRYLRYRS